MQFIGYHISDHGKSAPVATAATREECQAKAIRRVLSSCALYGEIGVQQRDEVDSDTFVSLGKTLDDWFAAKGIA